MSFMNLLLVALMPILKTLFLSGIGLILAMDRINLLDSNARHSLNNMVFYVFTPCLMGAYLAETVTLDVMIQMWFMPINILITFIIGSILGWILIKVTGTPQNLKGLIIGCCAAGNLGNLLLIVIPAICSESNSPFGETSACIADGAGFVSVSMAVGGIYIWSYVYAIMKTSAENSRRGSASSSSQPLISKVEPVRLLETIKRISVVTLGKIGSLNLQHLLAPSTIGSIIGFVVGVVPLLNQLLIGRSAPLRVVYSTADILGEATVPCVTLIVGANLLRGIRRSGIRASVVLGIIFIRFVALPLIGVMIVRAAVHFGLVNSDPLYQFVLMLHFALPSAMTIGTISQLFEEGEAECSVIMLWTYAVSALALTLWSTFFMSLVS
ncbi:hypothetical protein RND81_06G024300 [Saponaria officinalis]|uniref:Auxin efflux carrier n=1 Tax=Saponaria officinalis TaxID=3572 RepID=A0AAW1K5J0_SAPOF